MPLGRDQAEEAVGRALDEEAEDLRIVVIGADDRLKGDRVKLRALAQRVAARREDEVAVLVGKADRLRRREGDTRCLRIDRRQEVGKDRHEDQQADDDQPEHARPGAFQPAPDERLVAFIVLLVLGLDNERKGCLNLDGHAGAPPRRTRGSSAASSMSAMMLPRMRVADSTSMKVAVT
ncbi:hypothetical protein D9M70_528530 [compost metagenome]